ncbi:superoxide dismutase [Pelomonas sp. APW6]|uniref:Superoxide dismutase n=1 Tax=Roseateles subflavus TaxID=3053353 RepID=A0ABT7LQ63_9BURK|nr:superoxide dismutase [Pelomonas sp. APW6]MDL5034362.1 superoxide dismutase [Pelomonas sp. APW6]
MKMPRRSIMVLAASGVACAAGRSWAGDPQSKPAVPPFDLPKLPWEPGDLAPVMSSRAVGLHYGKHHAGYLDNLNKLMPGSGFEGHTLEQIVRGTSGLADKTALFNNAAQGWNHAFFWQSLTPKGGGKPGLEVLEKVNESFGSLGEFRKAFLSASAGQFGSGWVWLVADKATKRLALMKTSNAETPIASVAFEPLAVLDVWEHAYYVDYENRRSEYAAAVLDHLLDWRFVEANLAHL